jgi:hypothetical protein
MYYQTLACERWQIVFPFDDSLEADLSAVCAMTLQWNINQWMIDALRYSVV